MIEEVAPLDRNPPIVPRLQPHGESASRGPVALIYIFFFLSGATNLVYEVIWLRELILVFGSTLTATSAVLSIFMGGLALGSFWAGKSVHRISASVLSYDS